MFINVGITEIHWVSSGVKLVEDHEMAIDCARLG